MNFPEHSNELKSNAIREQTSKIEPRSLRTFTPSQAVLSRSAGVFHWTPEGRRLYDFTSGVLVANLGHNPADWMRRFFKYMGWSAEMIQGQGGSADFFECIPFTTYNAITPIEIEATRRLIDLLRSRPGGQRMEKVMWSASGSEAVQKALWMGMARDRSRDMILATRYGFHGKKGLACAVTGSEEDRERDPRVKFIRFPMAECADLSQRDQELDLGPFEQELHSLMRQYGRRFGCLITEPYLGGGGSYHPPARYLQFLERFCRENDLIFILDEVQANFGRTRELFAFEAYGLEPDLVVLGKGLGNGVPVAAVVGRVDLMNAMDYGEASDTWSANPLCSAGVLATLDAFEDPSIMEHSRSVSRHLEGRLNRLRSFPFIAHIRGEKEGMVWGIETKNHDGRTAAEWANAIVLECYRGDPVLGEGIHFLGPLAKKVLRVSPPLVISREQVDSAMNLMESCLSRLIPGGVEKSGKVLQHA